MTQEAKRKEEWMQCMHQRQREILEEKGGGGGGESVHQDLADL